MRVLKCGPHLLWQFRMMVKGSFDPNGAQEMQDGDVRLFVA